MGEIKNLGLARIQIAHREVIDKGIDNTQEILSMLPPKLAALVSKINRIGYDVHFRFDPEGTFMYQEPGQLVVYVKRNDFREDFIAEWLVLFIIRQTYVTTYEIINKIMPAISGTLCIFGVSLFRALIEYIIEAVLGYNKVGDHYREINSYINGLPISSINPKHSALMAMVAVHALNPSYTRTAVKELKPLDDELAKWCTEMFGIIDSHGMDTESKMLECLLDLEELVAKLGLINKPQLRSGGFFSRAMLNDKLVAKVTNPYYSFGISSETESEQRELCQWVEVLDCTVPETFWKLSAAQQELTYRLFFEWLKKNSYIRIAKGQWPEMNMDQWLAAQRRISGQVLIGRLLIDKAKKMERFLGELNLQAH